MTYQKLPMLGMDGVLCDRPQDGCFISGKRNYARGSISNKEKTKVKTLSQDQLSHYVGMAVRNPAAANRYWARCMGTAQDAAMDDEAGARRDLKVAEEAAKLAAERCWDAQSKLEALREEPHAPSGALADSFIASVASGAPCGGAGTFIG